MLSHRLLLSLVVVLSLCAMAAATPLAVNAALPRSATGINDHFSPNDTRFATVQPAVFTNDTATPQNRETHIPLFTTYAAMPGDSLSNRHRAPDYRVHSGGHGVTAPEPGTLALLSAGLFGIAGIVRRKLVRS